MNKTVSNLLLVLGLAAGLAGCSARQTTRADLNRKESAPAQAASPSTRATSTVGFASREKLVEHYRKHGSEFGNISMEEYLRVAQTMRDAAAGATIIEAVRTDGVTSRFDRETGTFIAFNRDGTIRTCFKPNDGEAYFRRQLKRGN
jgi:pyocin large subunit-like protein